MGMSTTFKASGKPQAQQVNRRVSPLFSSERMIQRLWYSRGKVLARQGYHEAALASFDAALRIQPRHHKCWVFRGVVLTHLQQYKAALVSFDRALEIAPDSRECWIFRGAVLTYLNCHHEARTSYSKALMMQKQATDICRDYPLWFPIANQMELAKSS